MILPGILALMLTFGPQGPGGSWGTVSAAGDVPPRTVEVVQTTMDAALERLHPVFPGVPTARFRVVLHRSAADLPAGLRPFHHESSPGFALLGRHEIHLMMAEAAASPSGLRAVIEHELTHELLDQACGRWGRRIPRWFHEGLAQVVAGDTYLGASEEAIVWRVASQRTLPFSELADGFPADADRLRTAYAQSYSYVAWLQRRLGTQELVAMARSVSADRSFEQALVLATGLSTATLVDGWRDHVLNGSGADWRVLLERSFALSMVLALPLLALAMIRRQRADQRVRDRMARTEAAAPMPEPLPAEWESDAAEEVRAPVDGDGKTTP